jgi:hypothetical protein
MTMPPAAHPDPERLAALAGDDAQARADSALLDHVASCADCDRQVAEMASLRVALAQLPDLAPSRPLQLVPPVAAPSPTGWRVAVRRAFAPVAVAGMVLFLIGGVGATGALGPADAQRLFVLPFQQAAGPDPAAPAVTDDGGEAAGGEDGGSQRPESEGVPPTTNSGVDGLGPSPRPSAFFGEEAPAEEPNAPRGEDLDAGTTVTSGWVLVAGVGLALLLLAFLLRFAPNRGSAPR